MIFHSYVTLPEGSGFVGSASCGSCRLSCTLSSMTLCKRVRIRVSSWALTWRRGNARSCFTWLTSTQNHPYGQAQLPCILFVDLAFIWWSCCTVPIKSVYVLVKSPLHQWSRFVNLLITNDITILNSQSTKLVSPNYIAIWLVKSPFLWINNT